MKTNILLLATAFLYTATAVAHPPVSIVIDSQGNIFYSDLEQVWMISPDGIKTVAVQNVHTHELWLDENDVLYGEDVANVGEQYRHRVWKRQPDGEIGLAMQWRNGHPVDFNDYGFARDAAGLMYVLVHSEKRIDVRSNQTVLHSIPLDAYNGFIHWLTVKPDGTVFVTIGDALVRFAAGAVEGRVVTDGLISRAKAFDFVHDRHALMGLWTDPQDNVYVSVFSGQMVKRVAPDGATTIAFRQTGAWSIAGGTIDREGRTLLLEFSSNNEVRVRRIGPNGETILG